MLSFSANVYKEKAYCRSGGFMYVFKPIGTKQHIKGKSLTLNVTKLKREILPPDADMAYRPFFERAKQGTASPTFVSLVVSLVIFIPKNGFHNCGGTALVAYTNKYMCRKIL